MHSLHQMTNLSQLEHLLALDETRHFARAAHKVHLSQPAFSRSIQALEKQTGLQLFERNSREIRPTPAGHFLIERARLLVQGAKSLKRDLNLFQLGEAGELTFGLGPFPCATLAPHVVAHLRVHHPDVTLRVEVGTPAALVAQLLKEDIEFFVADSQEIEDSAQLQVESIMRQYGRLYARKGHPLAGKPHAFQQVWPHGLASVKLPKGLKQGLFQLLEPDGLAATRKLTLECDDIHLLQQVALQTNTVVASTEQAAAPWLAAGELVALDTLDFPRIFANICLISLPKRMLSKVALAAMQEFRKAGDTPHSLQTPIQGMAK